MPILYYSIPDELKELELIQKELEQARADVQRLAEAYILQAQRINDIKEEELKKYWDKEYKDVSDNIGEDTQEDYYEDR